MAFDDPLNDGESDPRSFVLLALMQPLEDPEELVRVLHIEAGAVVANEEHGAFGGFTGTDLDARGRLVLRILERVAQQVDEDLLQQVGVGVAVR